MDSNASVDQQAMNENADADREPVENAAAEAGQETEEAGQEMAAAADNVGDAAENAAENAAQETEEAGQEMAAAADNVGDATENAAENAAQETEQAGDKMQSAASDAATDAEQKADAATYEKQEGQDMAAAPAEGDQADNSMSADNQQAADASSTTGMVSNEQTASTRPSVRDGMQSADQAGLSADELIGTTVYGANDESIGEIGDVIIGKDKNIEAYVIDVGGFLGLGEKPVAISPQAVELMKQPESNDYAVFTRYTEDQLEDQNAYSAEDYERDPDTVLMR